MNQPEKKYHYFQPGEILFLISHESDRWIDAQINEDGSNQPLNAQSDNEKREQSSDSQSRRYQRDPLFDEIIETGLIKSGNEIAMEQNLTIIRLKDRELHFPGTGNLPELPNQIIPSRSDINYNSPNPKRQGAFSVIPVEVKKTKQSNDQNSLEGQAIFDELAKLVRKLDEERGELERNMNEQRGNRPAIKVEVVSPNWLSSPTSEWGGGGGPGSRPVPYTGNTNQIPWMFKLPTNIEQLCPEYDKRGEGVKVAILDTAPCLHDLAEAYERYQKIDSQNQGERHPLIERLLGPNGRLHVYPASLDDLIRMRAVYLEEHDYKMTDHGLFVAGIINTVAPAAELHLYEVLNPQGVGDLASIAGGLLKVAEDQYNWFMDTGEVKPLVVNCSLVLNVPLDGDTSNPDTAKLLPQAGPQKIIGHRLKDLNDAILEKISGDKDWIERAGTIIMRVCDLLYWCGSRVIAAAGNEWRPDDEGRPEARYPAAFESVLGIGALPKEVKKTNQGKRKTSSFSNLSDAPGRVGVATLGGEPGKENGVLGVYLGNFPPEQSGAPANTPGLANKNNWAWWAGTSFATPIVTGSVAAVLSGFSQPAKTEDALTLMYDKSVIENDRTEYEEDLLDVKQELPPN